MSQSFECLGGRGWHFLQMIASHVAQSSWPSVCCGDELILACSSATCCWEDYNVMQTKLPSSILRVFKGARECWIEWMDGSDELRKLMAWIKSAIKTDIRVKSFANVPCWSLL